MARDAAFYLDRALGLFNAGFASMAKQKEALSDLNSAFDLQRAVFKDACLAEPRIGEKRVMRAEVNVAYWDLPSYPHQWKPKHADMVRAAFGDRFDALILEINALVALRAEIKAAPLAPVPDKVISPYEVKVRARIEDIMKKRRLDYVWALEIGDLFGGLPVSVNSHWVHGHKGAVFLRNFYYLRGRMVALNVIIAAAQQLERQAEEAHV